MFAIRNASKYFGSQVILEGATWQAPREARVVGLIGPNGAGKTTLLRLIVGEEQLDGGALDRPGGMTLGFLPQEITENQHEGMLEDLVLSGRLDLLTLEAEIARLEDRLQTHHDAATLDAHSTAVDRFEALGGYQFRARARQILAGIGFAPSAADSPIASFSGGWQMRALLARLLLQRPDVLLLDEPTNHLDTESLDWLESFLGKYEGVVVVVSHDRYFLNRMATEIVELQGGTLTSYPGNYDDYRARKAAAIEQLAAAAARQAREEQRISDFIERFRYKATKARQVQSRVKALEKMERVDVPVDESSQLDFRFPQPERTPKIVAELAGVRKAYGANVVYESLDFVLHRGTKLALVGPNGAGKTTLLKLLAGAVSPDDGEIRLGPGVRVSYFAQHAVDQLQLDNTIYDELLNAADVDVAPRVRSILGAFGFSGDDVTKRIRVLSGGEKNRVALAKLMLEPAGLLLLDEPTNHLDIASRQVLEFALRTHTGAMVVVSHDRYFVDEVADVVAHVEHGTVEEYLGDYTYYRWKRDQERAAARAREEEADPTAAGNSRKESRRRAAELRKKKADATRELRALLSAVESNIAELETEHAELQGTLADPALYDDHELAQRLTGRFKDVEGQLDERMLEWESLQERIEALEATLDD